MERRAVEADIPRLVELAKREHALSQLHALPFDERRTAEVFGGLIKGMSTVVFISDGGYIVGAVQPMLFSRLWNAYEIAWYAEDGSGMALLRELAKWAKAMQAFNLIVHNYAGVVAYEQFTRVMSKFGFSPLGAAYTKQVGEV